jgi:hypothetical protein
MNYMKAKESFELYLVIGALDRNGWKIIPTAKELGITKQGVYKTIKKYKLKPGAKAPSLASFLIPEGVTMKPVRRVVLFDPLDFAWIRSRGHIGSYSQLVHAGIKALRGMSEHRIRLLC